jgi:hypothetical protein
MRRDELARAAVGRLPSTVRVGPYDCAIEKWSHHQAAGARRWGEFSAIELTIRIQKDMPCPVKAVDTFLHELGHAIYWAYNIDDGDKEERIITTQATAYTQMYRDNPWLLAWIGTTLGKG